MGEVADLLRAEHQQEGAHSRPADSGGRGPVAPLHRNLRHDRREFHPAGARPDRRGLRSGAGHSAGHDPAADARVRTGRSVARQPCVRLRHRGRIRGELADRVPGPHSLRAVLDRRSERRHPRGQRAAVGTRVPAHHRPGRHDRGRDDRRGPQHRRRTGHRIFGVRGAAATRGQSRPGGSTSKPLSLKRCRRVRPSRQLDCHCRRRRQAVGRALRRAGPTAMGARSQAADSGWAPGMARSYR